MTRTLADDIDSAIAALELLLVKACRETERDDLPPAWNDDLDSADEAAQEALSGISEASDFIEHVDEVNAMLRKIQEHDAAEDAQYFAARSTPG